jgi:hypothetical protein
VKLEVKEKGLKDMVETMEGNREEGGDGRY